MPNKQKTQRVTFHIEEQSPETVLGFESCEKLNLIQRVYSLKPCVTDVEKQFPTLFTGMVMLPGEHHITLDSNVFPVVHAPRKIRVALIENVIKELESMEKQGVIVKQNKPTEWVNSMVTVINSKGKLRICTDPKEYYRAIRREHHLLKTIEDILPLISKAKVFTNLDASCGFWQCAVDKESQKLCTMNTRFGRYSPKRLPYGI